MTTQFRITKQIVPRHSSQRAYLFVLLLLAFVNLQAAGMDKITTDESNTRYWAWFYNYTGGPAAYDKYLIMCHEFASWGVTDIIWDSVKGAVPWPTELELTFTDTDHAPPGDFEYNRKHDRTDALCRAAKKYGMKIWFTKMARESSGIEILNRYGWEKKGGTEFGDQIMRQRKTAGLYATDRQGRLIKHGKENWQRYYDLNRRPFLDLLKDQLTELKKMYGHYDVIEGFVLDEFELTLLADPLSDDVDDFADYCEKEFGEKYIEQKMPQTFGVDPENRWWRREMLYRIQIMNSFLAELVDHAHSLDLKIIKPNRNLEGYDTWTWKSGMDIGAYSEICDYVWISTRAKSQVDPYLNIDNIMVGIGMAYGNIAERFSKCFHGMPLSDHAYPCGTTTNHLNFYTEAERELFFGHQNNRNWFNLFNAWTGGTSPAKVAVAVNSPMFTMRYPKSKTMYDRFAAPLFEDLSADIDIDGFQFFQIKCLQKYPVVIVPHAVPVAVSPREIQSYINFVKEGGVLISVNARWSTGSRDLTNLQDRTELLTGLKLKQSETSFAGSIISTADWLKIPDIVLPKTPLMTIESRKPEVKVLATDDQNRPLLCEFLIGKGKVYSILFPLVSLASQARGHREILQIIQEIIKKSVHLPITAEGNLQIVQTIVKNDKVAVVLQYAGQKLDAETRRALQKLDIKNQEAQELGLELDSDGMRQTLLKSDPASLGIAGKKLEAVQIDTDGEPLFSVKELVTGRVLESPYRNSSGRDLNRYAASWTREELIKGIPVALQYENEFKVVAIAEYEGLRHFSGVLPGTGWRDTSTTARKDRDTPTESEMGLNAKHDETHGIKVGIYRAIPEIATETFGAREAFEAIQALPGYVPIIVDDIRPQILEENDIKVLIYCQALFKKDKWIQNLLLKRTEQLRDWVKKGGGLLARHDVSGYRQYPVIFPSVCQGGSWHTWGATGEQAAVCTIQDTAAILTSFRTGESFRHSYEDHVQLKKGPQGKVLAVDRLAGKPVLIAGEIGKGKFIADGTLGSAPETKKLSEEEVKILLDAIKWLAH